MIYKTAKGLLNSRLSILESVPSKIFMSYGDLNFSVFDRDGIEYWCKAQSFHHNYSFSNLHNLKQNLSGSNYRTGESYAEFSIERKDGVVIAKWGMK